MLLTPASIVQHLCTVLFLSYHRSQLLNSNVLVRCPPPFIISRILWPVSSSPLSSPPLGSLPLSSPPVSSQHFSAYPFSEFVNVPVNYPHRIDPQVYTEWYTSFHISNNCIHISKHWTHTKDSVFGASRDNLATHIQSVAVVSGCCCLRMCQSCCDSAYVSCISRASDKSKSNYACIVVYFIESTQSCSWDNFLYIHVHV